MLTNYSIFFLSEVEKWLSRSTEVNLKVKMNCLWIASAKIGSEGYKKMCTDHIALIVWRRPVLQDKVLKP